jgi:hypothetical protein
MCYIILVVIVFINAIIPIMAAGRLYCVTCNEEREIVEVKTYQGFDEKILSSNCSK